MDLRSAVAAVRHSTLRSDRCLEIDQGLTTRGFWRGRIPSHTLESDDWRAIQNASGRLPRDQYALDASRYRTLNRFTLHMLDHDDIRLEESSLDDAYYQAHGYNPELGGVKRQYERSDVVTATNSALTEIIRRIAPALCRILVVRRLRINVHHVRYLATGGVPSRNSPPGYHKDGEQFISVHLLARKNVLGGMNRVADNARNLLAEFILQDPGDCFVIDDEKVWHAVDEITVCAGTSMGTRDILLVDYLPA